MHKGVSAREEVFVIVPESLKPLLQSRFAWILATVFLCVLTYSNSLRGELVHDDVFAIRDNADVRPSTPLTNLLLNDFWGEPMTSPTSHKSYRPLTVLTFRLNYLLHELDPVGYHVVTGIVGRADVLACVLFLCSFLLYFSSVTSLKQPRPLRVAKFVGCLAMGAAAMLSKEHGATVFGVCLAYDVLVIHWRELYICIANRTIPTSDLRPLILRSSLLILTAGGLLSLRVWLLHGHLPHFGAQDNPTSFAEGLPTRLMTYSYLFFFNAKLLLYPAALCYDYQMGSIPLVESVIDPRNLGTAVFYFVFACLTWRGFYGNGSKGDPVTLLGLLMIIVPFLPASNILIRVGFVVAERILYISSMGYCVLVGRGAVLLAKKLKTPRPIISLLLLMLVSAFCVRAIIRNPVWSSREALFASGLHTIPHNAKIHFNYANYLKDSGRETEAIEHYKTAIRLWPQHAVSHNNLGTLLTNLTEAEHHFRQAALHNPQHFKSLFNLGSNLVKQGRIEEAEKAFRRSLSINPSYADTLMGLATLLGDKGRLEEGWGYMEQATSVAPSNAAVLNNLGAYLWKMGKTDEAIKAYQRAISVDPTHTTAMTSLARVHRGRGENSLAEQWFKRALSVTEDPATLQLLGALYHNTGSLEQAAATFARALRLTPDRVQTVCSYGQTLIQLRRYGDVILMLNKAMKEHPTSSCLHSVLASAYIEQKELDKALDHSYMAVEFADDSSLLESLLIHGGVLKDLARYSQAEKAYRQAVQVDPNNLSSRLNLGALLHLAGNYPGAREQYEHALKLDPNNSIVRENIKKLDRLEKKTAH